MNPQGTRDENNILEKLAVNTTYIRRILARQKMHDHFLSFRFFSFFFSFFSLFPLSRSIRLFLERKGKKEKKKIKKETTIKEHILRVPRISAEHLYSSIGFSLRKNETKRRNLLSARARRRRVILLFRSRRMHRFCSGTRRHNANETLAKGNLSSLSIRSGSVHTFIDRVIYYKQYLRFFFFCTKR